MPEVAACTFPSCRCEWSKRGEHCPRYGGSTYGYEPSQPPEPPVSPEPESPQGRDDA